MIKIFTIESKWKIEFIDITRIIEEAIDENIEEGLCHIYTPHTTAGLTINENYDPNVQRDIINTLNKLIPEDSQYLHMEGNAHSHIKTSLIGNSLTIPINNGKLMLGRWQGIFLCEFDGPRKRYVHVTIIPIKSK